MSNSLTKLEFEKGLPFKVVHAPEHGKLSFQQNGDNTWLARSSNQQYFCDVEEVKETGFLFSYVFLNQPFRGFIHFKDCTTQTKN